jgi:hypothetical protein
MDEATLLESERNNHPNRVRAAIDGTDFGGGTDGWFVTDARMFA